MDEKKDVTQELQNKVDKLKLLNLTDNIRNLIPPQQQIQDDGRDIALVKALSVAPRIQDKYLEIRGLEYDPRTKQLVQVTTPIMNIHGAYRFCKILKMAEEIEWSSYSEDEIPQRITHFYEINFPMIIANAEEYELKESDYNYVETTLQTFIDTSFHKSKSGKYINTLGRTYGEDVLKKAFESEPPRKQNEGFISKYNPFKERSNKW